MSSGSRIKLYAIAETTIGETPVTGTWYVVPRVTDALNESVTTTASAIVGSSRFRQGAIATDAEITGDLASELSAGTFDLFMAAVAMNNWSVADTLEFGGSIRKTYTFVKVFEDIGIFRVYRGVYFNSMNLNIARGEYLTINFGLVGTGYEQVAVNPVVAPVELGTTPLVSSLNVKDFEIDGQGVVGTACLQSLDLEITNNLEAIYCIGNGKLSAEKYVEKLIDINLNTTFMFSGQVAEYDQKIKSGDYTSISFDIEDSLGNGYTFNFPRLQVTEAAQPDAGGDDLVTQDITFAHVEVSPTITRFSAPDPEGP